MLCCVVSCRVVLCVGGEKGKGEREEGGKERKEKRKKQQPRAKMTH